MSYLDANTQKRDLDFMRELFGSPGDGEIKRWVKKDAKAQIQLSDISGVQIEKRVSKHWIREVSCWDKLGESEESESSVLIF